MTLTSIVLTLAIGFALSIWWDKAWNKYVVKRKLPKWKFAIKFALGIVPILALAVMGLALVKTFFLV